MHNSLKLLNEKLQSVIVEKCKDRRVLIPLTGGIDSRALLSVLMRHAIVCDALTNSRDNCGGNDITIAKKICNSTKYIKKHILLDEYPFSEECKKRYDKIFPQYDVVLSGRYMSFWFDKFEHIELSERGINEHLKELAYENQKRQKRWPNYFIPSFDKKVRDALQDVPILYRYFHYPQLCIIKLNYPKLSKFPYTTYNLKKRIGRTLHRNLVWICEYLINYK